MDDLFEEILELRAVCPLLAELDEHVLRTLAAALEAIRIRTGEDLVREGEKADKMFIVLEGRLEILAGNGSAGGLAINEIGPGDTLGEVTMFSGGERTATVRALEECRLAALDLPGFNRFLEDHPETSRRLSEVATDRLRRSQLVARVKNIFGSLDSDVLHDIEKEVEWLTLKGGATLYEQGDNAESAFIVINGRLRVVADDTPPEGRVLYEIGPGETVGEIALLTEGKRSASVYAVRDCEVVKFSHAAFERLVEKYPGVMMHISRLLGSRILKIKSVERRDSDLLTTFAIVPVSDVVTEDVVHRMAEAMSRTGPTLHLTSRRVDDLLCREGIAQVGQGEPSALRLEHWLSEREAEHRFVLYQADSHWSGWTERCIRQADHVLYIAVVDFSPRINELEMLIRERLHSRHPPRSSLILVHQKGEKKILGTSAWLVERDVDDHFHVRLDHPADLERLARILTGNAVGLVLGGGGARGLAHIGVIRAFEELGIPIDIVGGASQGAIIAGACGMDYRSAEIHRRCKTLFDSFFDFTFPMVSLLAGFKIRANMIAGFGDRQIEDLPVTFYCVSTNLSRAEQVVHRSGLLLEAVRSSMSLPGLMPPVYWRGDLLADGGILNNVPADVMRSLCGKGKVVAVDVTPDVDLRTPSYFPSELSGWKLLRNLINPVSKRPKIPSIINLLQRSSFTPSVNLRKALRKSDNADIYLQLPVEKWGMMDFKKIDEIVEAGYRSSLDQLRTRW